MFSELIVSNKPFGVIKTDGCSAKGVASPHLSSS
uniref:Uncharacterized protein n=1 Tax=Anguilla anguilla TaxID=7936 RepID=A0A0E9Q703_ANGAN